jgi:hypothetical protein
MEPQKVIVERRRHPRYHPDRKNQPQVSFTLNGADKHVIDVVNISQGGLLGYTQKNEHLGEDNHNRIKQIEISFPGKHPFHCSGELLRVKPTRERYKCFCAIQFDEIGYDAEHHQLNVGEKIEQSLRPSEEVVITDQQFINRVEEAENYMTIKDARQESEVRRQVYDSFDEITSRLSLEEQWCFFEIIDEMKRREPDYPEELKRAFVNLCRIGIEQSLKEP